MLGGRGGGGEGRRGEGRRGGVFTAHEIVYCTLAKLVVQEEKKENPHVHVHMYMCTVCASLVCFESLTLHFIG